MWIRKGLTMARQMTDVANNETSQKKRCNASVLSDSSNYDI